MADNEPLLAAIRHAIEVAGGRITFRDFMALALYHPIHGYYHAAGERTGKRGDYLTSPHISGLFGQTLARFLEQVFHAGTPRAILEMGAGDGTLAEQLAGLGDYLILERSDDFRGRQRERLDERATWIEEMPEGFRGVVLSNELLDALPVHRVDRDQEVYVRWKGQFIEELGPYSISRIDDYFSALGLRPVRLAEVNLDALDLMETVYRRIERGIVLTIDYGYEAEDLFLRRPQGTFLTYSRHTANDNPYEHIGLKDMTSHVDFTSLIRLGESLGLRTSAFTTQADFLIEQGIGDLLMQRQQAAASVAEYYREREAVTTLLNPGGMGGFRVLVQERRQGRGQ